MLKRGKWKGIFDLMARLLCSPSTTLVGLDSSHFQFHVKPGLIRDFSNLSFRKKKTRTRLVSDSVSVKLKITKNSTKITKNTETAMPNNSQQWKVNWVLNIHLHGRGCSINIKHALQCQSNVKAIHCDTLHCSVTAIQGQWETFSLCNLNDLNIGTFSNP